MGIPVSDVDVAGKETVISNADLSALDGGKLNASAQTGVVTDLDATVVILQPKNRLVTHTMGSDGDYIVVAVNLDGAVNQLGEVSNLDDIVFSVVMYFASFQNR